METPNRLTLYELIATIEDVEVPPEFESELLHYILGLTNGMKIAKMIAQIFKSRTSGEIDEFIDALDDHILEVMTESCEGVSSDMVTAKKMLLSRLIIHFIYN